jgi:Predicted transcriptional regulators
MIFNNEFGSKVKELRKMRMLSQKDVAEYLNVTPTQISDIENGKTAPSFQRAIMLATLFEISLDYLAGISEQPQTSEIDSLFNSLTYEQQMRVLGYIDALKNNLPKE